MKHYAFIQAIFQAIQIKSTIGILYLRINKFEYFYIKFNKKRNVRSHLKC